MKRIFSFQPALLPALAALLVMLGHGAPAHAQALMEWPTVEQTHKPWTRWWWMGSAVDDTTLTTLLETYQAAGLGGVEITPIYGVKGEEGRFLDFLSPAWMARLHHTVEEARRLGMGVDMATGTGWPFGGPHVRHEDAAARFLVETYTVEGGESLADAVAREDDAVDRPARLQALMAYSDGGDVVDLTARVDAAGRLDWTAPAGRWQLVALFQGWTGQQVKRAAPGGEGNVIDHFSPEAFAHYIARFDSAFAPYGTGLIRAFFNDSFEAYGSNWTEGFLEAFARRRGYDLRDHLLAFVQADTVSADHVGRVLADYQQTISELLLEAFTRPWVAWAHRQGSLARNQAHGSPGNLLDLYAAVDIPETETFNPDHFDIPGYRTNALYAERTDHTNPLVLKFASSAAHVADKPLASAETATWLDEHFMVSLSQVKPTVDKLFAAGINHVFYHGTAYSPPGVDWPGWLFYAATHFGPTNTFWPHLKALNAYVARCQAFLQADRPDADVLLYFPVHDVRHGSRQPFFQFSVHNPQAWLFDTPLHAAARHLMDRGHAFDYVSDELLKTLKASDGMLVAGGGAAYDVVLVPESRFMPAETLEQLLALAQAGATVLVHRRLPDDVPGLGDLAQRRVRLRRLRDALRFAADAGGVVQVAPVGQGRVIVGEDIQALLEAAGLTREPVVDRGVSFVRRRHDAGYTYFLAHQGAEPVDGWVPLGTRARGAVLFDPLTETSGVVALRDAPGGTEVYLQLEPGQALLLRTVEAGEAEGPAWPYLRRRGTAQALEGPWQITFLEGGPALPEAATMDTLVPWTALEGEAYRRFAGTARYAVTFDAPADSADVWMLDLGRVAESAFVRLNGEPLGYAFSLPFRLEAKGLREGQNTLEIEVASLMANRIADMDRQQVPWRKFYDANVVNLAYEPFDASGWPVMESGLVGPVRLVPYAVVWPGEGGD